jgi:Tfp pilus assembly protein PilX
VTTLDRTRRDAHRSARRRRPFVRALLVVLASVFVFLLGIAFARTLDDRPRTSGNETIVRTLTPVTQSAPGRTVTVTVTSSSP